MLIIRELNCIDAASGIVTLSKWLSGAQVERELFSLNLCTGEPLSERDDTRCCINTIQPPDDELYMAVCECCRLNCMYLICIRPFSVSFRCANLLSLLPLLVKVVIINSLCSVYTLLTRSASLDISCSVKNDSRIFPQFFLNLL